MSKSAHKKIDEGNFITFVNLNRTKRNEMEKVNSFDQSLLKLQERHSKIISEKSIDEHDNIRLKSSSRNSMIRN